MHSHGMFAHHAELAHADESRVGAASMLVWRHAKGICNLDCENLSRVPCVEMKTLCFSDEAGFFFFFRPGKDSPVAMSREDLARDLWIHCTSRTKQLGLPYPSETTSIGDYIIQ